MEPGKAPGVIAFGINCWPATGLLARCSKFIVLGTWLLCGCCIIPASGYIYKKTNLLVSGRIYNRIQVTEGELCFMFSTREEQVYLDAAMSLRL